MKRYYDKLEEITKGKKMGIISSIFREYDIRGTYPDELNEEVIEQIAFAIAKKCHKEGIITLAVGRDGRLSGESLLNALQIQN